MWSQLGSNQRPSACEAPCITMSDWHEYQEAAARFFREIGMEANTDVSLEGVRTKHDIDVVVRSKSVGFDLLWVVECKHWKDPVSKLHILGLRQIVNDLGADRGILLSESGFQKGAMEAASLTNVYPTSMAELRRSANDDLARMRLALISERLEICKARYWSHSKSVRIDYGLRPEVPAPGWSGDVEMNRVSAVLQVAYSGVLPVKHEGIYFPDDLVEVVDITELIEWMELCLGEVESRLDTAEEAMERSGRRQT